MKKHSFKCYALKGKVCCLFLFCASQNKMLVVCTDSKNRWLIKWLDVLKMWALCAFGGKY